MNVETSNIKLTIQKELRFQAADLVKGQKAEQAAQMTTIQGYKIINQKT